MEPRGTTKPSLWALLVRVDYSIPLTCYRLLYRSTYLTFHLQYWQSRALMRVQCAAPGRAESNNVQGRAGQAGQLNGSSPQSGTKTGRPTAQRTSHFYLSRSVAKPSIVYQSAVTNPRVNMNRSGTVNLQTIAFSTKIAQEQ